MSNIAQAQATPTHRNEVSLLGAVARPPEVRTTTTGRRVANLVLVTAVSANHKQFHRCTFWGGLAEKIEHLKLGDLVELRGRLETSSWQDPKTGEKKYATSVVAASVDLPEAAK